MRNIRYSIGERLKDIRIYFGYTQKQIAHILNISRSLYIHFELNVKMITLQHLVTLTNFYQGSVDSLLALTEDYDKASEKITLNANIISNNRTKAKQVWHPCITTRHFYFTESFELSIDQFRMVATLLYVPLL